MKNNNYRSVSILQEEPPFMYAQAEIMKSSDKLSFVSLGVSTSNNNIELERHIQVGNFFGNTCYSDFSRAEATRQKIAN